MPCSHFRDPQHTGGPVVVRHSRASELLREWLFKLAGHSPLSTGLTVPLYRRHDLRLLFDFMAGRKAQRNPSDSSRSRFMDFLIATPFPSQLQSPYYIIVPSVRGSVLKELVASSHYFRVTAFHMDSCASCRSSGSVASPLVACSACRAVGVLRPSLSTRSLAIAQGRLQGSGQSSLRVCSCRCKSGGSRCPI